MKCVHFLRGRDSFLAGHDEERAAKLGKLFKKWAFFGKGAEGRAGGAVIGVEVSLDRIGAAIERRLGEIEIVPGKGDDDRETAIGQLLVEGGRRIHQLILWPVAASKRCT